MSNNHNHYNPISELSDIDFCISKGRVSKTLVLKVLKTKNDRIKQLKKENAALKKALLSVGDEFKRLKDQYEEFTRVFIKN